MKKKNIIRKKSGKDIDFTAVFNFSPASCLLLLPDKKFTIAAASDSYNRVTNTIRKEIVGRQLFEVFPDNPNNPNADGVKNLKASLQRVLLLKKADAMPLQKYDIPRPAHMGGGFEERYWDPLNTPVLSKTNVVKYIIHSVKDVTEVIKLKEKQAAQLEWNKKLETAQKKHLENIKENESMFKHLTQNLSDHAIFMLDADGFIVNWNEGAEKLNGYKAEEIIGRHVSIFYQAEEIDRNEAQDNLNTAVKNGHFSADRWRLHKDNSRYRAKVVITPVYNDAGRLTGFTNITSILQSKAPFQVA